LHAQSHPGIAKVIFEVSFGEVHSFSVYNYPSFVKIKPCGGVVDEDKVGDKFDAIYEEG